MEKEVSCKLPFLDVLIGNNDPHFSLTKIHPNKTSASPLTNYFSFTSYSCSLIKTLVDRAYKSNNTWLGFHEDITKFKDILKKYFSCSLKEQVCKSLYHYDPKQSLSPGFPSHHHLDYFACETVTFHTKMYTNGFVLNR